MEKKKKKIGSILKMSPKSQNIFGFKFEDFVGSFNPTQK